MTHQTTYDTDKGSFVKISGDVDICCAGALLELEKELSGPAPIVFDVSRLRYADTTFLRFLLKLRSHANKAERGSVKLIGVNGRLRRIFEITGLSHVFALEVSAAS